MTEETPQAGESPAPAANPVETPPPATPEDSGSAPDVNDADDVIRAGKGVGKRIDELTRNWREAERREQALLQLLQRDREDTPRAPAQEVPVAKTLADFGYDEGKYQAYMLGESSKAATVAARAELKAEQERETGRRRLQNFRQKEAKFEASTPDYKEVAYHASIHDDIAPLVMELEDGPQVAYYLGKNPEIAAKLGQLPPAVAAIELGRIETRLAFEREKVKPKVSAAPPPPPKIEAASDPAVDKDPSTMSDVEFAKWRRRQIAQRR